MFYSKRRLLLTKMAKWPTVGKTNSEDNGLVFLASVLKRVEQVEDGDSAVSIKQPKTIF